MNSKKVDFEAFASAVAQSKLNEGVDSATCHHSAVNVNDWPRIQAELAAVENQGSKSGVAKEPNDEQSQ